MSSTNIRINTHGGSPAWLPNRELNEASSNKRPEMTGNTVRPRFYTEKDRLVGNAERGKKYFSSGNSTSVGYVTPNDQS